MVTTEATQMPLFPFEALKPEQLGSRTVVETDKNVKKTGVVWKIPLDLIYFREGFNVREDITPEAILDKKISLLENGQRTPGKVDAVIQADGSVKYLMVEGHIRTLALRDIYENDGNILYSTFDAIVNPKQTTEIERILDMFITQDSHPLKQNEIAKLFNLLLIGGLKQVDIARKCSKSPAYVSQMVTYFKESDEVKKLVDLGLVSADTVRKLQKEIPDQELRTKKIMEAVNLPDAKKNGADNSRQEFFADWDKNMSNNEENEENEDSDDIDQNDNEGSVDRQGNYLSTEKKELDTIINNSGKAKTISINKITGKPSKRERGEELAGKIIIKYDLGFPPDSEDDNYIELVNLISNYI